MVEIAHAHDIPVHTDAVQAVGQVPVDFAACGVDALTLTAHKAGGPFGVGALVVRRDIDVTPQLHGGGQERDIRSGTIDILAIVAFATAVELAVKREPDHAVRVAATARRAGAPGPGAGDGRAAERRHRPRSRPPAPRKRPPDVRVRGRLAADAARRTGHRDVDGVGVLGRRAAAVPRAAGHGLTAEERAAARCASRSGHTSTHADVDAVVEAIGPWWSGPASPSRPAR